VTVKPVLAFVLALAGCCIQSAQAAAVTGVQLSSRDRQAISDLACPPPASKGSEHLEAKARKPGSTRIDVAVRCQSHRLEGDVPVSSHATCNNDKGQWLCAPGRDGLILKLGSEPVTVFTEGVPAREAIELIRAAARLNVPPMQFHAREILRDQCTVKRATGTSFKGATLFEVDCSRGTMAMTRDCWDNKCRHFTTGGTQRRD
jgi:hypothetical protein